ncbi:MAG: hypothetical protein OEM41_05235 [Ignavibacteria bacterium]|nr:hypothetical protein [Ignavibacteria bacterium]
MGMSVIGYDLERLVANTRGLIQVRKADLRAGDYIFVLTSNSVYSIRVQPGGVYVVSGGWFDRKGLSPTRTTIAGCTWGGSVIKVDIVAARGLCLEFGNRLITSTIRNVFLLTQERHN